MSDLSPDSGPHIDQVTWFDGHCHFDFPVLDDTRDSDWAMAQRGGVTGGILPAVSYQCSAHLADFAAAYNGWYFAAGLHPYWIHEHKPQHLNWLSGQLSTPRCVAVGECGLDRTLAKQGGASLELQWFWLMHQLDIAQTYGMPLVLHVRGMHDELASELRRRRFSHGGLVHAFSGSLQQAEKWHDLGFCLGIGGAMTHPGARRLRDIIRQLPDSALLLETDAPDMRPAFLSRHANSPAMIPLYGVILAALRSTSAEHLASALQQNLYRVFPRLAVI